MRTPVVLSAAVLLAGASVSRQHPEEAAVRAALEHYLQGHATGEGSHMRIAFHPKANLYFIRDGQYTER
ncbi:MAG: nuclear transport factor 2 family protein [Gemmatimonadales bacterium]